MVHEKREDFYCLPKLKISFGRPIIQSRLGHQRFNIKCFRIIKNKFDLLIFPNQIKVEFNLNNLLAFIEALIKVRYDS